MIAAAALLRSCTPDLRQQPHRHELQLPYQCWDNAAAESFFAALKNEMYHRQAFPTRAKARFAVAGYIEVSCNRIRLHSTLGYRTPAEVLTELQNAATDA